MISSSNKFGFSKVERDSVGGEKGRHVLTSHSEVQWMLKIDLPLLERASKDMCPQGEAGFHLKQESEGDCPRGPRFPEDTVKGCGEGGKRGRWREVDAVAWS